MKKKPSAAAIAGAFGQPAAAEPSITVRKGTAVGQSTMMADAAPQAAGAVDVEPIIAKARAGLPKQLLDIFDKAVLSGMRVMFDKGSHQMMLDELDKPGPLAERLSNGIIALVYLLWQQSNKSLPPQIMVPLTLVLTLRAFEFLQESQDPEATPDMMGEAVADAVKGVMDRFGATEDVLRKMAAQGKGQPAAGGMLSAAQKGK